jgi:hypothetical protein
MRVQITSRSGVVDKISYRHPALSIANERIASMQGFHIAKGAPLVSPHPCLARTPPEPGATSQKPRARSHEPEARSPECGPSTLLACNPLLLQLPSRSAVAGLIPLFPPLVHSQGALTVLFVGTGQAPTWATSTEPWRCADEYLKHRRDGVAKRGCRGRNGRRRI